MKTSNQPKYVSLRAQVYDYLREELLTGRLRAGRRVNLDAMAESLGVSRTPLREALILLGAEGFVSVLPRSGIVINSLSLKDIKELYGIVGALEGAALFAARPALSPASVEDMGRLNATMSAALDRGDWEGFYRLNLEFHGVFLAYSDNASLVRQIDLAKRRLYEFPKRKGLLSEWERASIEEHRRIVDFLRSGDFRAAAEYLRDVHWSFEVQEHFIRRYYELADAEGFFGEAEKVGAADAPGAGGTTGRAGSSGARASALSKKAPR